MTSRITVEDIGSVSYQPVDVKKYDLAVAFLKSNSASYSIVLSSR